MSQDLPLALRVAEPIGRSVVLEPELALQLTRSGAQPEIRVFAISEAGMASELHYHKSYGRGEREYVLGKTGSK